MHKAKLQIGNRILVSVFAFAFGLRFFCFAELVCLAFSYGIILDFRSFIFLIFFQCLLHFLSYKLNLYARVKEWIQFGRAVCSVFAREEKMSLFRVIIAVDVITL